MVREGWLKDGPGHGEGRGAEPFVAVSWEKALELVSGELSRVKETYSNEAIFGGSYGWASAGIFHHARTQLRRFLFAYGGCVDQSANYSFGTATAFIPHVVGDLKCVTGPMTTWTAVAKHTEMLVLFGGVNPKNAQVARGGCVAPPPPRGWRRRSHGLARRARTRTCGARQPGPAGGRCIARGFRSVAPGWSRGRRRRQG